MATRYGRSCQIDPPGSQGLLLLLFKRGREHPGPHVREGKVEMADDPEMSQGLHRALGTEAEHRGQLGFRDVVSGGGNGPSLGRNRSRTLP